MTKNTGLRPRLTVRAAVEKILLAASLMAAAVVQAQNPSSTSNASVDPEASESAGVAEIVVTAQRREERLQDVPISVTAFSAAAIESAGFRDTRDILVSTPNVDFSTSGRGFASSADISIRGVGTVVRDIDQPVAVYSDDVFLGTSAGVNLSALDLERVEVLRGPQGTLYGRNALAGAVNYVSREPQPVPEGSVELSYGNLDYTQVKAVGNLPVAEERLMVRGAVSYTKRDGTIDNLATGTDINDLDNLSARLSFKSQLTDALTLKLSGEYAKDNITASAVSPRSIAARHENNLFRPFDEDRKIYGATARLVYDAEGYQLMSITGWRSVEDSFLGSYQAPLDLALQGGSPASDQRQISQEFRIVSTGDRRVNWVLGAYYYDESRTLGNVFEFHQLATLMSYAFGDMTGTMIPQGYSERSYAKLGTEMMAGFGEVNFAITDRLKATVGARYGHEKKDMDYAHVATPYLGFPVFGPPQAFSVDDSSNNFLPKLTLDYRLSSDAMLYATVSKGFKSGGFSSSYLPLPRDSSGNPITGTPTQAQLRDNYEFDPETLWNYEVGVKSAWLDNRLVLNGAAFYMDWKNQQLTTYVENVFRISNADKTRSYGAELELVARPTSMLALNVGLGYNDSVFRGDTIVQHPLSGAPTSAAGKRQPNSSKLTGNLGAQLTPIVGPNLRMPLRVDLIKRSSQYFDALNLPQLRQPGYTVLNLRLGLETDRWAVSLFANNLTNKDYFTSGYADSLQSILNFLNDFGLYPARGDEFQVAVGDPRTYGIIGRVKF